MSTLIVRQVLLGLTNGMLLVLIASGLSLVFGVMNVVNFAHGSLLMIGAYFGLTVMAITGNFWLALHVAPIPVAVLGFLIEYYTISPLYGRDPLWSLLLTIGISLIASNGVNLLWGPRIQSIQAPAVLSGTAEFGGIVYPAYRLFALVASTAIVAGIWLFLRRTRHGLAIRAGVHNREMVDALGVNISRIFTAVFVLGAVLAAVAGVLIAPIRSIYPELGNDMIISALIVVVVGGMGSFEGAVVGSLLLGLIESLGALFLPRGFVQVPSYVLVALILLLRPAGLLGEELVRH